MKINFLKYASVSILALSLHVQHVHATNSYFSTETCEEDSYKTSYSHQNSVPFDQGSSSLEKASQESTLYREEGIGKIFNSLGQKFISQQIKNLEDEIDKEMNLSKENAFSEISKIKSKHEETMDSIASTVLERLEATKQPLRNALESLGAGSKEWEKFEDIFAQTGSDLLAVVQEKKEVNKI